MKKEIAIYGGQCSNEMQSLFAPSRLDLCALVF